MLLLLALLTAPLQDAVVREKASSFTYAVPKGWTRQELENKSVAHVPPGTDAQKCTLLLLPGQDVDLDDDAAHEALFRSAIQGSTIDGKIARSTLSGWKRSQVKVTTPQQQELWTAVQTIKQGKRLEAALFVAATEALYKAHLPAVDQVIASIEFGGAGKAPAPAGTAIHGLQIPVPPTWTRKDEPTGAVLLVPAQLAGVRPYFLYVLPPTKLQGTLWETHKALLRGLLGQVKWSAEPVTVHDVDAPGPFIRSSAAGQVPEGGLKTFELYTVAHDGVLEAVVGVDRIDRNVTDPVLAATTLRTPPKASDRPRIVEAYRRLEQKTYVNREGGAPTAGSLMYERIWLRSDGVADFSTFYLEGYAASPLVTKVDASLLNGDFGAWKSVGERIHLVRREGSPPEIYERDGDGLQGGGRKWEAMPRVDAMKLSGRWASRSPADQKVSPWYDWIEFNPDGRFSTEGLLRSVAVGDGRRKPPDKGSGTYELRDWTLFLAFDDGQTWSTDFSILGRDPKNFPSILLRTTAFPREK